MNLSPRSLTVKYMVGFIVLVAQLSYCEDLTELGSLNFSHF